MSNEIPNKTFWMTLLVIILYYGDFFLGGGVYLFYKVDSTSSLGVKPKIYQFSIVETFANKNVHEVKMVVSVIHWQRPIF